MNKVVKCAECECAPVECTRSEYHENSLICINCKVDSCCCLAIHSTKETAQCCNDSSCKNVSLAFSNLNPRSGPITKSGSKSKQKEELFLFLTHAKGLYAAALGIEILCIAAAEIGENTGLYLFGFNMWGIIIAYAIGFALAGFATFVTILGRYDYNDQSGKGRENEVDSCCSGWVTESDFDSGLDKEGKLKDLEVKKLRSRNLGEGFYDAYRKIMEEHKANLTIRQVSMMNE